VQPGRMFVFETGYLGNPRYIINFPTKRHWKAKSRIEDIERGLVALKHELLVRRVQSVAVPPLGSGLGGLEWPVVRQRIERALADVAESSRVVVFEPQAARTTGGAVKPPEMTAGRAALIGLMGQYLGGLLDPFVTLLEVHKLMYFMQEAGEPLRLRWVRGPYGPYAENLRHVLQRIEGYYVHGYADGGEAPGKQLALVPGAAEEASEYLSSHVDTRNRFGRVADLVEGFETSFGLELLATAHWLLTRERVAPDAVVPAAYAWNARKRRFSPRQIHLAVDVLAEKGWLPADVRPLATADRQT
jgi:hypothetical protein